jgi:hypothetical protein
MSLIKTKILHKIPNKNGVLHLSRIEHEGDFTFRLHASADALIGSGVNIEAESLGDVIKALQDANRTYGPQKGTPGRGQGKLL